MHKDKLEHEMYLNSVPGLLAFLYLVDKLEHEMYLNYKSAFIGTVHRCDKLEHEMYLNDVAAKSVPLALG